MARQHADTLASYDAAKTGARTIAASLRKTKKVLLLGMGGSHAVGRAVEPLYRATRYRSHRAALSEQLGQPLSLEERTVIVASQSGESAEVVRWFRETGGNADTFGLTLEGASFLARTVTSLIGVGGTELAFAATRSLMVTFGLHLAIFTALGADPSAALSLCLMLRGA